MEKAQRLISLDVLRGITIAGMIIVNNPGSWKHVYTPLTHAVWNGLTPTDLVFPFFMFIMGISTYISLKKFNFSYVNIKRPTHKVGQVYTKIDIKPSGLTKERLAFMKTQMRLLYDDK